MNHRILVTLIFPVCEREKAENCIFSEFRVARVLLRGTVPAPTTVKDVLTIPIQFADQYMYT